MKVIRTLILLSSIFISLYSQSESHVHSGTAFSLRDFVIRIKGVTTNLLHEYWLRNPKSMKPFDDALKALVPPSPNSEMRSLASKFVQEVSNSKVYEFHMNFSRTVEEYRLALKDNPAMLERFNAYIKDFTKNFKAWTGNTPEKFVKYDRLVHWTEEFANAPEHLELRNRLFPKMHSSRQRIFRQMKTSDIRKVWANYAKRIARENRSKVTIMFSQSQLERINPDELKEIFRTATDGKVKLTVSQKVNSINVDPRRFRIVPGVDEVDLLVSSSEHTSTPGLLDNVEDWTKRKVSRGQKRLRDQLRRWVRKTESPRISFHMFEGDHPITGRARETFFRNLNSLDHNNKLKLTINHGMTLDPSDTRVLRSHFGKGRLRVSLQPSTYRILGGKQYQKIAYQFKRMLNSSIKVTLGSDDPGLYTCPASGTCYGDPRHHLKGILDARDPSGRYILNKDESAKLIARYIESVTDSRQGLDLVHNLKETIDSLARKIPRELILSHYLGKFCG